MTTLLTYRISDIRSYINWLYFDHAWGLSGKPDTEKQKLRSEAERLMDESEDRYYARALFGLFDANSDGDDIIINDGIRLPFLRQQHTEKPETPFLCLADFVRPGSSGVKDKIGLFAVSVDSGMEHSHDDDVYLRMLAQTTADRIAEATAEKLHEEVRRRYWGYAPDEHLSMPQLLRGDYEGIRPAVGYPSLPDISINFLLSEILGMNRIGIRLTESGAMIPHSSVSGLMFSHPRSHYFDVGKIGEDQLRDYARRRGFSVEKMHRFLVSNT